MPEPAIDFRGALRALLAARVRFVIVGGIAMHLHGANNLTLDLDISYARDPANCNALANILFHWHGRLRGAPADLPFVLDARTLRDVINLTLDTDIGDVDLLGEPAGIESFESLWERAVVMHIEDMAVRVASIDDLIAMKRAANRPKDQNHLLELYALKTLIAESKSAPQRIGEVSG